MIHTMQRLKKRENPLVYRTRTERTETVNNPILIVLLFIYSYFIISYKINYIFANK